MFVFLTIFPHLKRVRRQLQHLYPQVFQNCAAPISFFRRYWDSFQNHEIFKEGDIPGSSGGNLGVLSPGGKLSDVFKLGGSTFFLFLFFFLATVEVVTGFQEQELPLVSQTSFKLHWSFSPSTQFSLVSLILLLYKLLHVNVSHVLHYKGNPCSRQTHSGCFAIEWWFHCLQIPTPAFLPLSPPAGQQ